VLEPAKTVAMDVKKLIADPRVSTKTTVSGHVYDVRTGLVTTVVEPMRVAAP